MLATPIGNLADISLRALYLLQMADVLACEDTRHSQMLLRQYGVDKPGSHWLAVHQHNEASAAEQVIVQLQQGKRVVYLSDAGTPGVIAHQSHRAASANTQHVGRTPGPSIF